jgi:hypothetical protein
MISIIIKNGAIAKGAPVGKKNPKNSNLWILNAIIFIPKKRVKAIANVINI